MVPDSYHPWNEHTTLPLMYWASSYRAAAIQVCSDPEPDVLLNDMVACDSLSSLSSDSCSEFEGVHVEEKCLLYITILSLLWLDASNGLSLLQPPEAVWCPDCRMCWPLGREGERQRGGGVWSGSLLSGRVAACLCWKCLSGSVKVNTMLSQIERASS